MMLSNEELEAIDNWRFENRVATRSEAIRRLCQMGLALDAHGEKLSSELMAAYRKVAAVVPFIAGMATEDLEVSEKRGKEVAAAISAVLSTLPTLQAVTGISGKFKSPNDMSAAAIEEAHAAIKSLGSVSVEIVGGGAKISKN